MDIQRATEILEIELIHIVNETHVRKQYHRLALQWHPDKNDNSPESTEKFKQINEAYNHLKNVNPMQRQSQGQCQSQSQDATYSDLLELFIQSIISRSVNESFTNIVKSIIISGCSCLTFQMFETCDKSVAIEVYEFICKYKHVLHISSETIDEFKRFVVEKCKNDQIYILNPTLRDLFEGNVYKLVVDGNTYYVPLWNAETYFDNGCGSEIVVRCVPELPDNISIDENNNVCVCVSVKLTNALLEQECINLTIYCGKTVSIKVSYLKISRHQLITFRREGIFQTNEYGREQQCNPSNIIVDLTLV